MRGQALNDAFAHIEQQLRAAQERAEQAEADNAVLAEVLDWIKHFAADYLLSGMAMDTRDAMLATKIVQRAERVLLADHPGADLLRLVRQAGMRGNEARALLRGYGLEFDKWPVLDRPAEPWTAEEVAALDRETLWQGVAFSFYSMLCEIQSAVEQFGLSVGEEVPDA